MSRVRTHTKAFAFIIFLSFQFFCNFIHGQTLDDAIVLLKKEKPDTAIKICQRLLQTDFEYKADVFRTLGDCYLKAHKFADAKTYYDLVISYPNVRPYTAEYSHIGLGLVSYAIGYYSVSKEEFLKALAMHATNNADANARNCLTVLGFENSYKKWSTIESKHFVFHFEDSSEIGNVGKYIEAIESLFDSINVFFKSTLPKRIDFFLWNNLKNAEDKLKRELAFAKPELGIIHTAITHTLGHEMAHVISFYAGDIRTETQFINEGTAVCFDLSNINQMDRLKSNLKGSGQTDISIKGIWMYNINLGDEIIYPLSGVFVKELIKRYGKQKFMLLLADQSYENAKKIYGNDLDVLIKEIEDEVNK